MHPGGYRAAMAAEHLPTGVGLGPNSLCALPLAMRRGTAGWERLRLFWLMHPYTPDWLKDVVRHHAPEVEAVEGGLAGLAELLAS